MELSTGSVPFEGTDGGGLVPTGETGIYTGGGLFPGTEPDMPVASIRPTLVVGVGGDTRSVILDAVGKVVVSLSEYCTCKAVSNRTLIKDGLDTFGDCRIVLSYYISNAESYTARAIKDAGGKLIYIGKTGDAELGPAWDAWFIGKDTAKIAAVVTEWFKDQID